MTRHRGDPRAANQLHGVTLERMVTALVAHFGWAELGLQIPIRCFTFDPSVPSSLKFLRRTPWARAKVEHLYGFMCREQARQARRDGGAPAAAGGEVSAAAADDDGDPP